MAIDITYKENFKRMVEERLESYKKSLTATPSELKKFVVVDECHQVRGYTEVMTEVSKVMETYEDRFGSSLSISTVIEMGMTDVRMTIDDKIIDILNAAITVNRSTLYRVADNIEWVLSYVAGMTHALDIAINYNSGIVNALRNKA